MLKPGSARRSWVVLLVATTAVGCVTGEVPPNSKDASGGVAGANGAHTGGTPSSAIGKQGGQPNASSANTTASGGAGTPFAGALNSVSNAGAGTPNGSVVAAGGFDAESSRGGVAATSTPRNGGTTATGGAANAGVTATASTQTGGNASIGGQPSAGGGAPNGGASEHGEVAANGGTSATSGASANGDVPARGGTAPNSGVATAGGVSANGGIGASPASGGASCVPVPNTIEQPPTTCSPSVAFCHGNEIWDCSTEGGPRTRVASCQATEYCDASSADCVARVCDACQLSCNQNLVSICNPNGSGFQEDRVDCSTTNQTCSHGACYSRMVDTVGGDPALATRTYISTISEILNFYEVRDTRYLLEAALYATLAKGVVLTCSVYEADAKGATYYLKSRGSGGVSASTTSAATTDWQPCLFSPNVPLLAGRFYAIGVGTTGGSFWYFRSQRPEPQSNTFAQALATTAHARSEMLSVTMTPTTLALQRLTTVP